MENLKNIETESFAQSLVNKIMWGWNLGNFLDCHQGGVNTEMAGNMSVDVVTKLWHNSVFNLECLDTMKKYGVNCLRIPVTWCNFISYADGKYEVADDIFVKLREIIDYALEQDFVVILDMHHDDRNWLQVDCKEDEFEKVLDEFEQIWKAIASEFCGYGYDLVFEGMNEIVGFNQNGKLDWIGDEKIFYERLSKLYDTFISAVRGLGGLNAKRPLMIATYGAQIHKVALDNFIMPKADNIIVDVHFYGDTNEKEFYDRKLSRVYDKFSANGIPVIIGECGNQKEYKDRLDFLKVYLCVAKQYNLKCLLWDNGSSRRFIDRETGELINIDFWNYVKNELKN